MMTKEEAKQNAAILLAYSEGKPIQVRTKGATPWMICHAPSFDFHNYEYSVGPMPTYRPYKDSTEFAKALIAHGVSLKHKESKINWVVANFDITGISFTIGASRTYAGLLADFCWSTDDTPCGVLEKK